MEKSTKQSLSFPAKSKRLLSYGLFLVGMALAAVSCGRDGSQESRQSGQAKEAESHAEGESHAESEADVLSEPDRESEQESGKDSAGGEGAAEGPIAVADFCYMQLDTLDLNDFANPAYYTIDGEWLYYSREVNLAEEGVWPPDYHVYISRGRIRDGRQEDEYIVQTKGRSYIRLHALLADGQGNCYVYWGPSGRTEEEDRFYSLEKYGSDGELLWKADYREEELSGMGDALEQGTVTADGNVFLYSLGEEGGIFSFGPDGSLGESYTLPELETLDGVASGKDGKVYGYCITGKKPAFVELGGSGEKYSCPDGILEVYDGRGSVPWVRKGDGVWNYVPETGELERLWEWGDEYIQISGNEVDAVFRDGDNFMVMCSEYRNAYSGSTMDRRPMQTFAAVALEDRTEYPPRQRITLGTVETGAAREAFSKLNLVVRMFNRQSREYVVEFVEEGSEDSMQMKFIQGKCADIIDLTGIYAGNLAGIGAFEDLTAYYEASGIVKREDILDPVREACVLAGENVLVMPSFRIQTLLSLEEEVTAQDWNVWDFLGRAENEWMILGQDPMSALTYCMGVRYGEYFIDYVNKECDFDSPEFRRLLEACGRVRTYEGNEMDADRHSAFIDVRIDGPWDMTEVPFLEGAGDLSDRFIGYPGMEGAEHRLWPESVFAMNSASKHKDGAWDFLEFLMSEEMQSLASWGMPSRKDVFEQSLTNIYVNPRRTAVSGFTDENGRPLDNGYAEEVTAHDVEALRGIVENVIYDGWGGMMSPLWRIVADEAGMYFQGDADLDSTVSKIQNRVQLYLDEAK